MTADDEIRMARRSRVFESGEVVQHERRGLGVVLNEDDKHPAIVYVKFKLWPNGIACFKSDILESVSHEI